MKIIEEEGLESCPKFQSEDCILVEKEVEENIETGTRATGRAARRKSNWHKKDRRIKIASYDEKAGVLKDNGVFRSDRKNDESKKEKKKTNKAVRNNSEEYSHSTYKKLYKTKDQ